MTRTHLSHTLCLSDLNVRVGWKSLGAFEHETIFRMGASADSTVDLRNVIFIVVTPLGLGLNLGTKCKKPTAA